MPRKRPEDELIIYLRLDKETVELLDALAASRQRELDVAISRADVIRKILRVGARELTRKDAVKAAATG